MPLSYTNRKEQTHYFKTALTKKGNIRYYVVKSPDFSDLIDEVPRGFEIKEHPYDGRVVLRKIVKCHILHEEKEIVEVAIAEFSAVKDFIIEAERNNITVFISQFSSAFNPSENYSREEASETFFSEVEKWMWYQHPLRFVLVDKQKRLFQAERIISFSYFGHDYHPIGEIGPIEEIAPKYGQHLGRPTFLNLAPKGYEDEWGTL